MPFRNDFFYCINHPNIQMTRNAALNGLVGFNKAGDRYIFDITGGLPVVALICPACRYIELYYIPENKFADLTTHVAEIETATSKEVSEQNEASDKTLGEVTKKGQTMSPVEQHLIQFKNWADEKGIDLKCDLCGRKEWEDILVSASVAESFPSSFSVSGDLFPMLHLTCSHCGNIKNFNAAKIGLIDVNSGVPRFNHV